WWRCSHSSWKWCLFISFCTSEIDSTPPATKISPSPAITRCAASAMVCRPEEQKRFTVIPGTVCGQPARIAIWRAMFQPVAPSGLAQPMITSSTSSASTFARSSAACTTWPPIFAPCVRLSAPRQLLQSGVLAVETITASFIEFPAFLGELHEERRRLPLRALIAFLKGLNTLQNLIESDAIRIEHRPAAVGRKAVAGEVDHVDVRGAQRDAFFEDVGAFVHQGIDQSLHDLLVGDRSRLGADFFPVSGQNLINLGVGDRLARICPSSGLVSVEALAGLLPEAALLADAVGDLRIHHVRPLLRAPLADLPADVVAGHVVHGERAHRHAELRHRG